MRYLTGLDHRIVVMNWTYMFCGIWFPYVQGRFAGAQDFDVPERLMELMACQSLRQRRFAEGEGWFFAFKMPNYLTFT